jgi:putative hydrolase of the HAD superfamily
MVDIYRDQGVTMEVDAFRRVELCARRVLHQRIDEGSNGTEPTIWWEYFRDLFRRSGIPDRAIDAVSQRVREAHAREHLWTYALPETTEALEGLKHAGYRIGVVSNADGRMETALQRAGVRGHVEFVIDSAVVGIEKPRAEIFHAGCDAFGMAPADCVYVGDLLPVDYVGATEAGLAAVLLDPLGLHDARAQTVRTLAGLGPWLERSV